MEINNPISNLSKFDDLRLFLNIKKASTNSGDINCSEQNESELQSDSSSNYDVVAEEVWEEDVEMIELSEEEELNLLSGQMESVESEEMTGSDSAYRGCNLNETCSDSFARLYSPPKCSDVRNFSFKTLLSSVNNDASSKDDSCNKLNVVCSNMSKNLVLDDQSISYSAKTDIEPVISNMLNSDKKTFIECISKSNFNGDPQSNSLIVERSSEDQKNLLIGQEHGTLDSAEDTSSCLTEDSIGTTKVNTGTDVVDAHSSSFYLKNLKEPKSTNDPVNIDFELDVEGSLVPSRNPWHLPDRFKTYTGPNKISLRQINKNLYSKGSPYASVPSLENILQFEPEPIIPEKDSSYVASEFMSFVL